MDNERSTSASLLPAVAFFILLMGLFVASVNFVGVMGRDESKSHVKGGERQYRNEGREHSTPNDPATQYEYQPSTDSSAH
jgi:hypothetical protein